MDLLLFWRIHATRVLCPPVCLHSRVSVRLIVCGGGPVCLQVCKSVCTSQRPSRPRTLPDPGHLGHFLPRPHAGTCALPGTTHHLCRRAGRDSHAPHPCGQRHTPRARTHTPTHTGPGPDCRWTSTQAKPSLTIQTRPRGRCEDGCGRSSPHPSLSLGLLLPRAPKQQKWSARSFHGGDGGGFVKLQYPRGPGLKSDTGQ